MDVGESSQSFNVNFRNFFDPHFFTIFFPVVNPAKMNKKFGWIYNGILFSFQKEKFKISILCKFQIYVEQLIFVVEKRLPYGKILIFNENKMQ